MKYSGFMIDQPLSSFFVFKVDGYELKQLSKADILRIETHNDDILIDGVERVLRKERIFSLSNFIAAPYSCLPSSIVLSVNNDSIIKWESDEVEFEDNENLFSIIDGQHRIESFSIDNTYDVLVCVFRDLHLSEQRMLFSNINTEQLKIDPSTKLTLDASFKEYTPEKMYLSIVKKIALDNDSPWFGKIKILGKKDELSSRGIISSSMFSKELLKLTYDTRYKHILRTFLYNEGYSNIYEFNPESISVRGGHVLWEFYYNYEEELLYKIINNYFQVIADIFPLDWNRSTSILTKSVGYMALMMLFVDIFPLLKEQRSFRYGSFYEILYRLKRADLSIDTENFAGSGTSAAKELYDYLRKYINLSR